MESMTADMLRERRAQYPLPSATDDCGYLTIPGCPDYKINHNSEVWSKRYKRQICPNQRGQVNLLSVHGKHVGVLIHRLAMLTFFGDRVEVYDTVDHLDEDYTNNHISNLVYCTQSENIKKSLELRPRQSGPPRQKKIEKWSDDGMKLLETYPSLSIAASAVQGDVANISAAARGKQKTSSGFIWKYIIPLNLPGEEWRSATHNARIYNYMKGIGKTKVHVSNMGRIKTTHGRITSGTTSSRTKPYRKYCNKLVHVLVMLYFGEENDMWSEWYAQQLNPKDKRTLYVLHNDAIHLDSDGCCSNAIDDLRLNTQRSNISESHMIGSLSRKNIKKKRKRDDKIRRIKLQKNTTRVTQHDLITGKVLGIFESPYDAGKCIGKTSSHIKQCCMGYVDQAYGFKWNWEIHDNQPPMKKYRV